MALFVVSINEGIEKTHAVLSQEGFREKVRRSSIVSWKELMSVVFTFFFISTILYLSVFFRFAISLSKLRTRFQPKRLQKFELF